ncbi:TOG array regulator of axonemal microtubules protein 2-like [Calypte anna]|uniref:TOG array regulator of axonemal microtubules protein 2-like n=1 Tax=Calypte anna TaxID=9244 RepID=UPI0011C3A373|nr:TOG array regulator of axonemal microtubules protein 2-like [Calypte anna]
MELFHGERERGKPLQLPKLSADLGNAARERTFPSFSRISSPFEAPSHIGQPSPLSRSLGLISADRSAANGSVPVFPSIRNAGKGSVGTDLRKGINKPSLPSVPIIKQSGSFPGKDSVNSLPSSALDLQACGEEAECGYGWEARPFSHPQQKLLEALKLLRSDDWEQKLKGLCSIRSLAVYHSEVLLHRLCAVSLATTKEVNSLRSKVSGFAIRTLGELFRTLKKQMDPRVDGIACALLQKMGDSNKFIQEAADESLEMMVVNVTPARAMSALLANGVQHRHVLVRKCAAKHLLTLVECMGAEKLLSGTCQSTEGLLGTLVKLAQDCHQDTRCYGWKMLNILMSHQKFDWYLKESVPSRDLEEIISTLKKKGSEDLKCQPPSAKDPRKSKKSNVKMSQENLPSAGGLRSGLKLLGQRVRRLSVRTIRTVEETEHLLKLSQLLTAQDFHARMEGLVLLRDDCKNNPQFISRNIGEIIDAFALTLTDCHKNVSQRALEVLTLMTPILRGASSPVMVSLVTAATDNLNSKHSGIYTAAMKALEGFINHLVLVGRVYPRKPQTVQRYVLPALWYFLGNRALPVRSGNVRAVVAKLVKSLYQVMGSTLKEAAAKQPQHVVKNLQDILDHFGLE